MNIFVTIVFCIACLAFVVYSGVSLYRAIKERQSRKVENDKVDNQ